MDAVSFPILRLPQSALKNALRQMCLVEHLVLSVLSTKAKQHITMLNEIDGGIYLSVSLSTIQFLLKSRWINFEFSIKLDQSNVEVRKFGGLGNKLTLSIPGFTAKHWINHIACVFLKNRSLALLVGDPQKRAIEERYEYIRELRIVRFDIDSHEIQECPLYDMFPLLKCLHFGRFQVIDQFLSRMWKNLFFTCKNLHSTRSCFRTVLLLLYANK